MNYHKKENTFSKNKIVAFISEIIYSEKLPFCILYIILVYIHMSQKMQTGDDFWFQQMSKDYSLTSYLHLRYFSWTGRMGSEAIFYYLFQDGGFLWKFLNPLFITLLAYGISRIVSGKRKDEQNCIINWYICMSWLFISRGVIFDAVMWMTGSVVYLWSMALALLAIIPFRDALMGEYTRKFSVLYILCAIFASISEEQVALVLVVFAIIININIYIRDKKIHKYLLIENLFMIAGSVILFAAPGNFVRNYAETINQLPNYPLYSKWEVGFYGVQWLLNTLLNNSRVIFLLVLLVLSAALYKKSKESKNKLQILLPAIGCLLIGSAVIFSIDITLPGRIAQNIKFPHIYHSIWDQLNRVFFNFNAPAPFGLKKLSIVKFFVWPVILAIVPYLIWDLYDFKTDGFYVALAYIAGICSAIIMFVSPTMYASNWRTFFVLAVMFLFVFICLVKKSEFLLKRGYFIIFAGLAIYKFIFIFYLN